jgi:hypothetical protein
MQSLPRSHHFLPLRSKHSPQHRVLMYLEIHVRPHCERPNFEPYKTTGKIMVLVKIKLSPCLNWAPRHEGVLGEWRYSFTHSWRRFQMEVSGQLHTPPLYPQGKSPWYPLERRLGGPHSWPGRGGEEKNSKPLPGFEPLVIQPVAQSYTTELSWILLWYCIFQSFFRELRLYCNYKYKCRFLGLLPWFAFYILSR